MPRQHGATTRSAGVRAQACSRWVRDQSTGVAVVHEYALHHLPPITAAAPSPGRVFLVRCRAMWAEKARNTKKILLVVGSSERSESHSLRAGRDLEQAMERGQGRRRTARRSVDLLGRASRLLTSAISLAIFKLELAGARAWGCTIAIQLLARCSEGLKHSRPEYLFRRWIQPL